MLHMEIDREKWDQCIHDSGLAVPYAFSWWLDVVSPGWEALVMDDYIAVMPLTARKKFGFPYLYQPFLTQQLGIFSTSVNIAKDSDFLDAIPPAYRFIDIQLNSRNSINSDGYRIVPRSNFLLDLKPGYASLSSNYHRNCRRNIRKGQSSGLIIREGPGVSVFSHFVERNIDRTVKDLNPGFFPLMKQLIEVCNQKNCSEILGIYTHEEMLGAGWFVHCNRDDSKPSRILFMVCASSAEGKKREAMYVLIDHIIARYAGSNAELDFTGSNLPGVAYFNAGFGAQKTTYPAIKRNTLPWWARMVKR